MVYVAREFIPWLLTCIDMLLIMAWYWQWGMGHWEWGIGNWELGIGNNARCGEGLSCLFPVPRSLLYITSFLVCRSRKKKGGCPPYSILRTYATAP